MKITYKASPMLLAAHRNARTLSWITKNRPSMVIGMLRAGLLELVGRTQDEYKVRRVPIDVWERRKKRRAQRRARRITRLHRR